MLHHTYSHTYVHLKYYSRCLMCPSCVQVEEDSVENAKRLTLTRDPAKYNSSSSGNSSVHTYVQYAVCFHR